MFLTAATILRLVFLLSMYGVGSLKSLFHNVYSVLKSQFFLSLIVQFKKKRQKRDFLQYHELTFIKEKFDKNENEPACTGSAEVVVDILKYFLDGW